MEFFTRNGFPLTTKENAMVRVGTQGVSGFWDTRENCPRCGGQGGSSHWYPEGGICFQCRGKCTIPRTLRVYTADKLATINTAADKKAEIKRQQALMVEEAKRQEFLKWAEAHADTVGGILSSKGNSFLTDLASKLTAHQTLTDKQLAAAFTTMGRMADTKRMDDASEFIGEIGDRRDFEVVVIGVYGTEGYYGHTDIVKMRDGDGNMLTWFASDYTNIERSDRLAIKGTIKKHDEYRGIKQTVITRCKYTKFTVVEADDAAEMEMLA